MFQVLSFPPFAFSPISFAIQGLIDEIKSGKHLHQDTDQGKAGKNPSGKDWAAENLRRMFEQQKKLVDKPQQNYNLTSLHNDDTLATDLILALVTKGFFDE